MEKRIKKRVLAIRFSAMGDVAMTSPVIKTVLEANPDLEIDFLTRPFFRSFFEENERLGFPEVDLKKRHKGILGLRRLYRDLRSNSYDTVIDLHDSLRSKVLRTFFSIGGVPVCVVDKGRKEKKRLLKRGAANSQPLMHTTQRYANVFRDAGLSLTQGPLALPRLGDSSQRVSKFLSEGHQQSWVGIAPFAAHPSKEWPLHRVSLLAEKLRSEGWTPLWFGAGGREISLLKLHLYQPEKDHLIAGSFKLSEELEIMKKLRAMICMDSANMHMAAISGVPVISIWGPTHPAAGFGPLNNEGGIVQADLPCRPCTIYGKIKSSQDYLCAEKSMQMIEVSHVMEKVSHLIR